MDAEATAGPVINVTSEGAVTKVVLREGTGEQPPKHARCLVHYVGRLVDGDEVFMDTRSETTAEEPVQVVAGRDTVLREVGLNLGVATMRKGERCRLRVAPQYGFGEKGSFSFPTVPPSAELEYDVELIDWEPVDEEKERGLMTYEERVEAAERRRQHGNALFKEGRYEEALSKYRLALSYLDEELLLQLDGAFLDRAQAVRAPALLNMAACQLRMKDFGEAIASCNQALGADPGNAKALFRRGRARHALGQTQAALEDLEEARKREPSDPAIVQELRAVKAELKEERAAEGQIFKGYFDKPKASSEPLYEEGSPEGQPAGRSSQEQQRRQQQQGGPVGMWHAMLGWLQHLWQQLLQWLVQKPHAS